MKTAIATTCFREAESVDEFIDALLAQSRRPDAIVIVDGGSDDGTVERIEARIAKGAPVRLVVAPGANRSVGRNRAVGDSGADVIALTDVGSRPRTDWFERIIAPLAKDDEIDAVAGYYEPDPQTTWERAVAAATVPTVEEVDPETFLPSGRSIAFRRRAWERAGGYPEWAWHNEDTPFDLALKAIGARFHFEREAVVEWRPQAKLSRLFVQFYRYARGDAQGRIWFGHYTKAYALLGVALALLVAGAFLWPAYVGLAGLAVWYWLRHASRARRRTSSPAAALLAPAANLVVDLAHIAGYVRGLLDGKAHGPGDH